MGKCEEIDNVHLGYWIPKLLASMSVVILEQKNKTYFGKAPGSPQRLPLDDSQTLPSVT